MRTTLNGLRAGLKPQTVLSRGHTLAKPAVRGDLLFRTCGGVPRAILGWN